MLTLSMSQTALADELLGLPIGQLLLLQRSTVAMDALCIGLGLRGHFLLYLFARFDLQILSRFLSLPKSLGREG